MVLVAIFLDFSPFYLYGAVNDTKDMMEVKCPLSMVKHVGNIMRYSNPLNHEYYQ